MTSSRERDFSNFELGDNVYELAEGFIPELAELLEVSIGTAPSSDDIQKIMQVVGTNKVLRDNTDVEAISRDQMVDLVERSGIQTEINRSLWSPSIPATPDNVDAVLVLGGMANWMDRGAEIVPDNFVGKPIFTISGTRRMDTSTETPNPNIVKIQSRFNRYPTEAEYAGSIIVPKLVAAGHDVLPSTYKTGVADEMLLQFFDENPDLLDRQIAVVRNANAGVLMAIQVRNAAQSHIPEFDTDFDNPQTFVITDTLPLAINEAQEADSRNFQKAQTALRQTVLTAKKLHETYRADS